MLRISLVASRRLAPLLLWAAISSQAADLSRLDDDTRISIEMACGRAKMNGPAPYRACIQEQLASIDGGEPMTDLSRLDDDTRISIEMACGRAKMNGPAPYRACIQEQLASIDGGEPMTELSRLDDDTRISIEMACGRAKMNGPAPYRACIQEQLASIDEARSPKDARIESLPVIVTPRPGSKPKPWPPTAAPSKQNAPQLTHAELMPWPGIKPPMPSEVNRSAMSPSTIFKRLTQSVYVVVASSDETFEDSDEATQGSAVAISPGHLLTNCHVVRDLASVYVIKGELVMPAHVSNAHLSSDRCLLELDDREGLVPVRGVREFSTLAVGEKVFAIGSPRGLENTLSEGLISGLREDHDIRFIQTSASISPGSSGGGLFDESGNLLGITTFLLQESQNLNFAISAEDYWK
jgi:hypothetical protein